MTTTPTQQGETLEGCPFCPAELTPLPSAHLPADLHEQASEWYQITHNVGCYFLLLGFGDYPIHRDRLKSWNTRRGAVAGPRGDVTLPEWTECQSRFADGTATALSEFIRAYEPIQSTNPDDKAADEWRQALTAVLNDAATSSPVPAESVSAVEHRWRCACGWYGTPSQMIISNSLRTCPQCGGSGGLILDAVPSPGKCEHGVLWSMECLSCGHSDYAAAPPERTQVAGEQRLLTPEELADIERFQQQRRKNPVAEDAWLYVAEIDRLLAHIRLDREQLENEIFQDATNPTFAPAPADDEAESPPTVALRGAILTCKSGSEPLVSLSFDRLQDAQEVHRWLTTLKNKPDTTKGDR